MARVALPESKLKSRRRRRRVVWSALSFLVLGLFVGGVTWLAQAPFLQASEVLVSGNKTLASSTVTSLVREHMHGSYFGFFPKQNIFLYPGTEMERALLAEYPVLRQAEVRAEAFTALRVVVVEREPRALWCGDSSAQLQACLFIDEEGMLYAIAPQFSEEVYPRYFGPTEGSGLPRVFLTAEDFDSLFALSGALAQKEPEEKVSYVSVDAERDARVQFASGFTVIFSLHDDGGDLYERYLLARSAEPFVGKSLSEFEYLDLRFGDRVYYKEK